MLVDDPAQQLADRQTERPGFSAKPRHLNRRQVYGDSFHWLLLWVAPDDGEMCPVHIARDGVASGRLPLET